MATESGIRCRSNRAGTWAGPSDKFVVRTEAAAYDAAPPRGPI